VLLRYIGKRLPDGQSSGGILVCAEVPFLPYMNLRPFRVDADGIHMYAWAPNGRTLYLGDLGAGQTVLAVHTCGRAVRSRLASHD
jgi:3-amino-4-hydroxybenzoic acid synthase